MPHSVRFAASDMSKSPAVSGMMRARDSMTRVVCVPNIVVKFSTFMNDVGAMMLKTTMTTTHAPISARRLCSRRR